MSEIFDRFFPHVTADNSHDEFRQWLRSQSVEDMRIFIAEQNLRYYDDRLEIVRLEIEKRASADQQQMKRRDLWIERVWTFGAGVASTLLIQFLGRLVF